MFNRLWSPRIGIAFACVFALVGIGRADPGQAQVYKCKDARGSVLYADYPCPAGERIDIELGATDPGAQVRLSRARAELDRAALIRKTEEQRAAAQLAEREAFRRATEVSRQIHIRYTDRKYKRVVALLDPHYDELWVGGKASYKLGAIIQDGGELIIFAPHLTKLSETHGALIEKYGYAPLESVRDMLGVSEELRENLCIAAHLAHVAYAGRTDDDGNIVPRYRITMASGLDEQTCKRVNLGYLDYRTFDYDTTDPDTFVVNHAGRDLYKVST